jgi:hypothetical protein
MHCAAHVSTSRLPLRKVAAALLANRQFPAWFDAAEAGATCPLAVVLPRMRENLVLRLVVKRRLRTLPDVSRPH